MNGVVDQAPTSPAADHGRGMVWEPGDDVGMAACVAIVGEALRGGLIVVRLLFA
jgi:hypothetical protein